MKTCLNCDRSEERIPLLVIQFRSKTIYICSQCLPVLIHRPEKLAEQMPGIDILKPAEHEH